MTLRRSEITKPKGKSWPFQDPELDLEARIDNILELMTVEEKIVCLGTDPSVPRLGIEGCDHVEGLHGLALGTPGGWGGKEPVTTTTFPQAYGLGETWDFDLLRRIGEAEGIEVRYLYESDKYRRGGLVVRCPNADLARDPRWGRTEECYGEDPFLSGTMAAAMVKGLQGDDSRYLRTAALLKHFLANSNENERTRSSSDFDWRLFHEYYAEPFRMAVEDGGARCYMAAYNAYNNVPCTVHSMHREITHARWGVDGIVCTDGGALHMLVNDHQYYPDAEIASAECVRAGINQFLDKYPQAVRGALDKGLLSEAEIDASIRGVFRMMIRLGLLDPPEQVPYRQVGKDDPWESDGHKALALEATQKSVVLLKNTNSFLPLVIGDLKSVAIIGKRSDEVLLDWYSGDPPYRVTALAGIREALGDRCEVLTCDGVDLAAAVAMASKVDVVILCTGNHPTGDAGWAEVKSKTDGKECLDRELINLEQEELVQRIYQANPKTVLALISSFPVEIGWAEQHLPAIVHMANNSQELGHGLADVLFGKVNPAGRTVQTWPRSMDHLPPRLDYDLRRGRTYMYSNHDPLYAFGHGLSYTSFNYSNLRLGGEPLKAGSEVMVSVDIENAGEREGDEVVQLYVEYPACAVERPKRALKGFQRIHLKPGEKTAVQFKLGARAAAWWDQAARRWVLENAAVKVRVGASSMDLRVEGLLEVEA